MNNSFLGPPPRRSDVSLIHKIDGLYKTLYLLSAKIPKRDRFGIWSKIEQICLELFEIIVAATFGERPEKQRNLHTARIRVEILKRLIRTANELNVVEKKRYFYLENELIEISKMINGWIKYLETENPAVMRG